MVRNLLLAFAVALVLPRSLVTAQSNLPPVSSQSPALDLATVLDSVAASHPALLAARARVRSARGSRQTAGQFANPMLAYQVENTPFPGGQGIAGLDRETMTMLTVPLEPLYQRGPRMRQANAQLRAAEADADGVAQMVALEAARAFYRVALAQVRVESTREVASWLDTIVAYNRARVEEGVTAEADLIRASVERDRALAEMTTQRAEFVRAGAELAAFTGAAPSANNSPIAFAQVPFRLPPGTDARARSFANDRASSTDASRGGTATRPDVRAAQERAIAAGAGVNAERTMLVRQLGVTVGMKQTIGTTSMIAGVSLPFPLFDRNRGEIERASAERDAISYDLEATTRVARAQLSGALGAAELLTERVSALSAVSDTGFLARAEQAKRITLGAYREGALPLFQVIDAVRAWSEARVTYFELLFAQQQSVLDLLFASGSDVHSASVVVRSALLGSGR